MATQTTGGGSTTSFTNTPQARDDNYAFLEDLLRSSATLYNVTTNTLTLDVMSNDLGGSAKSLFSVEDGDGNPITADFDLLAKDVNAAGVSNWEPTLNGNWVRINNGKVEYRIADGSGNPGQGVDVNSLTAGQIFSDQFVYAIRLGNGTLSEATVKINITGANDNATIGGNNAGAVSEDGVPNTTGGTLVVTDADAEQNELQPIAAGTPGGNGYGTFEVLAGGQWTYTLSNANPAVQALAAGAVVYDMITVTSEDGTDTEVITVTVTGTNDGPVANTDSGSTSENAAITVDVLANDTDVDAGVVLTVTAASAPAGTASIVGNQVRFDPGTDFDYLAVGESALVVVSYSIVDEHGASSSSTLTITVTGTNDAPVAVVDTASTDEDNSVLINVLGNDSDVDASDVLSISAASVTSGLGSVAIESGQLRYDPGSAYNYLAVGESALVTLSYTVSDGNGGTDTESVTVTVTGTNDAPVAMADTASTDEDTSVLIDVLTNDSDPDTSDTLSITAASVTTGLGSVTIESGQLRYDPGSAYNYLAVGESALVTLSYTVSDGNGGTDTESVAVTVTGTNDAPVAMADTASTDEDTSVLINVLANDSDPDASDVLSISAASVTAGLGSVTIESGQLRYDPGSAYNYLAVGESALVTLSYTVSDGNGATDTESVTVTVTGTNDAPTAVADTASTDEDTSVLINVLGNDSDPDTSDVLTISAASVSSGLGSVTIESGQLRYDPGSAYNSLAVGESATVTLSYTISDGNGGVDTESVTVTVTGSNDAPAAVADVASTDEENSVLINVLLNDSDPDTSDTLAISTASVTTGLGSVTIEGGQLRYDPSSAYNYLAEGESATVTLSYTVSDGNGGTDTAGVTVTVTGTNDMPALTAAQAVLADGTEDIAYNVTAAQLLTGFSDPDSSDVLAVFGLTASDGATVTQNIDGSYTITPAANNNGPITLSYSVIDGNGGSVPATLTFNLAAVNDPAVISGTTTGTVVEATPSNAGTPTATGTLLAADVDNPPNTFVAVASTPTASGYGSFTMTAGGVWTYTLNNANATVNALATGMFLIDSFTVQSADGTTQTISVTINGATDATVPPPTENGADPNDFDSLLAGSAVVGGPATLNGGTGADTIHGSNSASADTLNGGNGVDTIYGHDGGDNINGQNGGDMSLYGQAGNDIVTGGQGGDQIFGGSGDDTLYGNQPPVGSESGDAGDTIYGGSGNDTIFGQGANDIIIGGYGADTLSGGGGDDTFRYLSTLDTNDLITDFMTGNDQIDLSMIDANSFLGGDQAFGWGGAAPTANGLWMVESGGNTTIFGDTDGNAGTAEFMLTLQGFTGFDPLSPPPVDITF